MRLQALRQDARGRKMMTTVGLILAGMLMAMVIRNTPAFQEPTTWPTSKRLQTLTRRGAEGGYPDMPEEARGPDGIQSGMRAKLIEEAKAMGDEDTPVTAGFGNPYLLVIVLVVVLGAASYFELGLDKVKSVKSTDAQDKELVSRVMKMQNTMAGMNI
mmetsp:Transcript_44907/g.83813  ORF Transcript_44907/g.83813 Transcript_44907/m.83813 type:complete len:158 (-) Transcript_44907:70-543(-)